MTSIFSLEGKRAAITGGADGIGFEMSSLFAQAGAQVEFERLWKQKIHQYAHQKLISRNKPPPSHFKVFILDINQDGAQASAAKINKSNPGAAGFSKQF